MSGERIAVYGGTFDPPHLGHRMAVRAALAALQPDRLLVIPTGIPPHKGMEDTAPTGEQRLEMARLNFRDLPGLEVSDLELRREGRSYTADTLRELMECYPGAAFTLVIGGDMLLSFTEWREAEWILQHASLAVLARREGEHPLLEAAAADMKEKYGAEIRLLNAPVLEISSTALREALPLGQGTEYLDPQVVRYLLRHRLFGIRPNPDWLRCHALGEMKRHRLLHTLGCEYEAVRLARRWGGDEEKARITALLHDLTKGAEYEEQLKICREYGIVVDGLGKAQKKLFHAITGAKLAEVDYAADPEIVSAIRWHTTGRAGMSLLEKIMYVADYMEPGRDFPGAQEVRDLAYRDLDKALLLGLRQTMEEVLEAGGVPHRDTADAIAYYTKREGEADAE